MNESGLTLIIDYSIGNITSVQNMLKKIGVEAHISRDSDMIAKASRFVLPGVGSFDHGVSNLRSSPFFKILENKVLNERTPILGVCLGAQLLMESSEEGTLPGLGWIRGRVVKFDPGKMADSSFKVPHMGWSDVFLTKPSELFDNMYTDPRFYFVHSYHIICENSEDEFLKANYGYEFTAGFEKNNIIGVQFHPEKSHKFGMRLYENFISKYR